jgi:hypothetical protein
MKPSPFRERAWVRGNADVGHQIIWRSRRIRPPTSGLNAYTSPSNINVDGEFAFKE